MLGMRHVALRVRDINKSRDFYTRVLGMEVQWQPDSRNVYLTTGSDNLALHEADDLAADPVTGPLDHIGFFVSRPEDVDSWADKLASCGIRLSQAPKTHRDGARSIYFRDPDGNLIQLLYHPSIR